MPELTDACLEKRGRKGGRRWNLGKQKGEWAGRPKNPSPSPPSKEEEEEDALSLPGKNGREEEGGKGT